MKIKFFVFSGGFFNFLNLMKTKPNITNATLGEVWPWPDVRGQKFIKLPEKLS